MIKKLFAFLSLIPLSLQATHNRAGEITYKRIAPFTQIAGSSTVAAYNYSITVIKYTDHGSGIADRCVDTVYFGDGSRGVAQRINGQAGTCGCPTGAGCGDVIVSDPGYKVKLSIYSIIHTYPGPGQFTIRTFDPNRNSGVHNIPNSVNLPFYIESLLVIDSFLGANSSPTLTNAPIGQATLGVCFTHNMGAVDVDGDSLSYETTPCRNINGSAIPGYFFPETGNGGSYNFNAVTGLLSWCWPQFQGEYNVALIVKEWRKNTAGTPQLIGYVLRDMQIIVKFGVVDINETQNERVLNIYPNPASDLLYVNSLLDSQIKITSIAGRVLISEDCHANSKFDISHLSDGIYFLEVTTSKETSVSKLVVRH